MIINRRSSTGVVFLWVVTAFLHTASATATKTLGELTNELGQVRSKIEKAQQDVAEQSKVIWQAQHDLEYSDPSLAKLRQEIDDLQKQMIQKRQELNLRIALLPGSKDLEAKRRALFENLQNLQATEQAILNEIKALEAGGGNAK